MKNLKLAEETLLRLHEYVDKLNQSIYEASYMPFVEDFDIFFKENVTKNAEDTKNAKLAKEALLRLHQHIDDLTKLLYEARQMRSGEKIAHENKETKEF